MTDNPEVRGYEVTCDLVGSEDQHVFGMNTKAFAELTATGDGAAFFELIRLTDHEAARAADKARIAELEAEKARCFIPEGVWHEGCPRHPYGSEWFIAKLDNGQRVVLKELPEEHSYDYRTADETYYSAYRIAAWMQFPDSQYLAALAQQGKESANPKSPDRVRPVPQRPVNPSFKSYSWPAQRISHTDSGKNRLCTPVQCLFGQFGRTYPV